MFHNIRSRFFSHRILTLVMILFVFSFGIFSQAVASPPAQAAPDAGTWPMWVLESGGQFRPAAPPDDAATAAEIAQLIAMVAERDDAALQRIAYWNAGAPSYRWNQIALGSLTRRGVTTPVGIRDMALLNVAIYDATVAAWDSKFTYNRARPSEIDAALETVIPNPSNPSYPSEYAVTAGAASAVLAWLFPEEAQFFQDKAQEAVNSRLLAGVEYPSDVEAGLELGRQVAALVIARGEADGVVAPWTGSIPTEAGHWTGENPAFVTAGLWQPWSLTSPDQFRPAPPPAYDSEQMAAEMAEVRDFARTPASTSLAMFWEYGAGGRRNYWFWNDITSRLILEARLDDNAPEAARAYALANIANYDAIVSCFDAKYTYWSMRPFQVDPTFTPVFTTPNHPSYPSAHSCISMATAVVLADLFPISAEEVIALAHEAGEARIWGGIHFRSDIVAGDIIGQNVAAAVLARGMADDS